MSLPAVAAVALLFGAGNTMLTRFLMAAPCPAQCGAGPLAAPLYTTLLAFLAMALSLLSPALACCCAWRSRGYAPLTASAPPRAPLLRRCLPLLLPTLLDALATALQAASCVFISAGSSSAMRGSLLLFTAAAGVATGEAPGRAEWVGIWLSTAGAALAGASALLDPSSSTAIASPTAPALSPPLAVAAGIALATASNAAQGAQVALEGSLLRTGSASASLTPAEVNGMEGLLGALLLAGVMAASSSGSSSSGLEDSRRTLCCLLAPSQQPLLLPALSTALLAAFAASTLAYMQLSQLRGGNFRALLMVARGALVWGVELALPALPGAWGLGSYGQQWVPWAALAAAGYVLLAAGGLVSWQGQSARELAAQSKGQSKEPAPPQSVE